MRNVKPGHPLGRTGLEYVSDLYRLALTKPLDLAHVTFIPNPEASTLTIRSRDYTERREVGKYVGEYTAPYLKSDLALAVPMPVLYTGVWPVTFGDLCHWLKLNYGIILEPGEFRLGATGPVLTESTALEGYPDQNDLFYLVATPSSIRWKAGTAFRLRVVYIERRSSISGLVSQTHPGSMSTLAAR